MPVIYQNYPIIYYKYTNTLYQTLSNHFSAFFRSFCILFKYICIASLYKWDSFINIHIFFQYVFDLATVITSKTRFDVLTLFIKNPALELGIRETARRIDANPMLVRHELILLQTSGLLKSRRVANSIQFSLDAECGAIEPLQMLLDHNNGSSPQTEHGNPKKPAKAIAPAMVDAGNEDSFDD